MQLLWLRLTIDVLPLPRGPSGDFGPIKPLYLGMVLVNNNNMLTTFVSASQVLCLFLGQDYGARLTLAVERAAHYQATPGVASMESLN